MILKSTRNQLNNCKNPYQGKQRKVLTVCSAGILRSPTLANYLHKKYGFNTRSCGMLSEFALIPMTQALVIWADEIVFVDNISYQEAEHDPIFKLSASGKSICVLDIQDVHDYEDEFLLSEIETQYPDNGRWLTL